MTRVVPSCARHTLIGVGVGPGAPDLVPEWASALLAAADVVFVPVPDADTGDAERAVLFYAEAWRVERVVVGPDGLDPGGTEGGAWELAALQVGAWLAARPGSTAVVATLGDPCVHPRVAALAEGVRTLLGELDVRLDPTADLALGGAR